MDVGGRVMSRKKNAILQARLQAHHDQSPVELWSKPGARPRASREWTWRSQAGQTETQTALVREKLMEKGWRFQGVIRPRGEA